MPVDEKRLYDTIYIYILVLFTIYIYIVLHYANMHSKYTVDKYCIIHIHIQFTLFNAIYVIAILFFCLKNIKSA